MENIFSPDRHHLHILGKLFYELGYDAISRILEAGEKQQIRPGEYLFRQGDTHNSLYIVLSGRLRAVREENGALQILGDIGEGEPTGEFALFTNEPRMAAVLAIRTTTVLEITKEEYLNLVARNPEFAGKLTGFLIKRLKRNMLEQHTSNPPKNIAVINLQADHDLSPWTDDIERTLTENGTSIQVFEHDSQPRQQYKTVFDSLEEHEGLNILVCSEANVEWSRQALLYADLVIVATDFLADSNLYPIEETLALYAQSILNKKIYIAFLHGNTDALPHQTSRWLNKRKVNLHIHVRKDHPADTRRFGRIISNQAVGVVFGGGGTKGFAHVGATRALYEAGVEIDFIGGTSAGALYGIGMSHCDFDFDKAETICEVSAKSRLTSNDYSWPLISIMSGKKLSGFIRKMFGESELEDIWVNSYCVSTNFSSSATTVHERGLASKMVLASMAIPGVFPPVVINGQLHVDGGVVDNLPIEPMYRYPVRHIIAISLSGLPNRVIDYAETPSAITLLWDKITGKRRYRIPGIMSLIINSLTLNSRQKQEHAKGKASLYIEMDLKGVGLLDDKKWNQTIKRGHEQMKTFLAGLPDKKKFWLRKPNFALRAVSSQEQ
ncbi:MAG: cyclic nucleotide-binding and patatin-like phospholipase domain-containing protein [Bacteroidota bacterium]